MNMCCCPFALVITYFRLVAAIFSLQGVKGEEAAQEGQKGQAQQKEVQGKQVKQGQREEGQKREEKWKEKKERGATALLPVCQ
jgi:hypothetical protein